MTPVLIAEMMTARILAAADAHTCSPPEAVTMTPALIAEMMMARFLAPLRMPARARHRRKSR